MKHLIILLVILTLTSCSVEQRIKEHSYTSEWYTQRGVRYQVYKTRTGRHYIIIINKNQTKLKRKYITL
jgi:hypothetical protein